MVKTEETGRPEEILEDLVEETAAAHGFVVEKSGWSRVTYEVFLREEDRLLRRIARIDSFVTTSGRIELFDDDGRAFAEDLGRRLEESFPIEEATIVRADA